MLKRGLNTVLIALLFVVGNAAAATSVSAVGGGCEGNGGGVKCGVQVPGTGTPSGPTGGGASGGSGCSYHGAPVACSSPYGTWSASRQCYVQATSPQPDKTNPIWDGHTDGTIYTCTGFGISGAPGAAGSLWFWSASNPTSLPDPKVLAQQAVTQMHLRAVSIGMAPEPTPGSVGLVGLPIWLWAASPDQSSWGPVTRTASAGGYSVTATGKVSRVVWAMGDGGTITCTSPGTPYADSFGLSPSPDCGYRYEKQGTYTVRATNYWTVNWSGIGQSGVINRQFTSSVVVTIGELQTVVKG